LRPQCRLSEARQTIGLFVGPCPTADLYAASIGNRKQPFVGPGKALSEAAALPILATCRTQLIHRTSVASSQPFSGFGGALSPISRRCRICQRLIFESSDQSGNEGIITAPADFDTAQEAIERAWQDCYVVSVCRRRQKQRSGQRRSSR